MGKLHLIFVFKGDPMDNVAVQILNHQHFLLANARIIKSGEFTLKIINCKILAQIIHFTKNSLCKPCGSIVYCLSPSTVMES